MEKNEKELLMKEQEYKEALSKVMEYVAKKMPLAESPNQIGCRVKLSEHGLEMQGNNKRKLQGVIIAWYQWMNFHNDGTVTVKWDTIKKPVDMHVSHVQPISKAPTH